MSKLGSAMGGEQESGAWAILPGDRPSANYFELLDSTVRVVGGQQSVGRAVDLIKRN